MTPKKRKASEASLDEKKADRALADIGQQGTDIRTDVKNLAISLRSLTKTVNIMENQVTLAMRYRS